MKGTDTTLYIILLKGDLIPAKIGLLIEIYLCHRGTA